MDQIVYKIKKKDSNLFSTGGTNPDFTKLGKSWSKGNLKKHMNVISNNTKQQYINECEIIEYTITATSTGRSLSLNDKNVIIYNI